MMKVVEVKVIKSYINIKENKLATTTTSEER